MKIQSLTTEEQRAAFLAATETNGYDPIAEADEEGREAYREGYTLREAVEEYQVDTDTDAGMAFIVAFREEADKHG